MERKDKITGRYNSPPPFPNIENIEDIAKRIIAVKMMESMRIMKKKYINISLPLALSV